MADRLLSWTTAPIDGRQGVTAPTRGEFQDIGNAHAGGRILLLIVLAAVIPVLIFGASVAVYMADRARQQARATILENTANVAERIQAELAKELDVAMALGSSATLDRGNLAGFYADAIRIVRARPLWEAVSLVNAEGQQVANTLRPLQSVLAPDPDSLTLQAVLTTQRATIGGIGPIGPISGKRLVPIRVPIERNGTLHYVLTVWLNPVSISAILRVAGGPRNWVGAILDRDGRILARTTGDERELGQRAAAASLSAIASGIGGFYAARTREGLEVETAFRRIPVAEGWTVHLGIPSDALNGPVYRSLVLLLLVGIGSLALGMLLAVLVARDLAQRRRIAHERATLALHLSEAREAVAVDAAELGTWQLDLLTQTVFGSARTGQLLFLPAPAANDNNQSWNCGEFWSAVCPEDRDKVSAAIRTCEAGGVALDVEFRVVDPAGGSRWIKATGRVVGTVKGRRQKIHGVLADIDDLKQAEEEKRQVSRRLAEVQEGERRRIARELHDQVGQTVTGLSLGLKSLEQLLAEDAITALGQVRWLSALAREIGRDIHRASSDLRPTALDDLGLPRAIMTLAADLGARHGLRIDVQHIGREDRLSPLVETALYRSVQEALTNILKHAGATQVSIVLERRPGALRIVVEDNGCGFDAEKVGRATREDGGPIGLSGIVERLSLIGGSLKVESSAGAGTSLFIDVPVQTCQPAESRRRADA